MTTMPMGPQRPDASQEESREDTTRRGSGSSGRKRSEASRYMGVRFTERQRDMIRLRRITAGSTCTTIADYRREYLHDYIWVRIKD